MLSQPRKDFEMAVVWGRWHGAGCAVRTPPPFCFPADGDIRRAGSSAPLLRRRTRCNVPIHTAEETAPFQAQSGLDRSVREADTCRHQSAHTPEVRVSFARVKLSDHRPRAYWTSS